MITQIGFDPWVYDEAPVALSSDIGDWFNNFWASLKAGDFGAIALTGVAIIMLVQVVETIRR
jgi:hypothetical protein